MDDIHLEDPRKFSAKQLQVAVNESSRKRRIWQYLFDLVIKTLLCTALISLDFTLFANAGNYNIFASSFYPTHEVQYIYIGIAVCSFLLMFAASFFRKLENIVAAVFFALLCVAVINQFATFEKHSGLLIVFNGIFSDSVNVVLYEYSLWIIGIVAFIAFWMLLNLLRRQFLLYLALLVTAVWGWVLSQAYFNASSQYFRTAAASPTLKSEVQGKNLIFLSFNSLVSPNTLAAMANVSSKQINVKESFNRVLGFLTRNDFILYPNALVKNVDEPFLNLISSYNPDSKDEASAHMQVSAIRDEYFIFDALQSDRIYLKDSSLYSKLRKEDYTLNVYQTRGVDVCYLNNKLAVALCKEKINAPTAWNDGKISTGQKTVLLLSQWLNSTGFVSSLNPLLRMIEYALPVQADLSMNFNAGQLYAVNAVKVFDQILDNLERQSGNQAYFAVIDMPSETYIYDEFCQLKAMPDWISEDNQSFAKPVAIDQRRNAYAEQLSCLFGALDTFIRRLDKMGYLENTTVIIEGLNTPQGIRLREKEFYRQLQQEEQVMLAIRPAGSSKPEIDYSVCGVDEILNSFFFTHKPCQEFSRIKTTDKNLKHIKNQIEEDKYKKHVITNAEDSFDKWIMAWQAYNGGNNSNFGIKNEPEQQAKELDGEPKKIEEIAVMEKAVEDVPEQPVKSISAAADEQQQEETDDAVVQENDARLPVEMPKAANLTDEKAETAAEADKADVLPDSGNAADAGDMTTEENEPVINQPEEMMPADAQPEVVQEVQPQSAPVQEAVEEVEATSDEVVTAEPPAAEETPAPVVAEEQIPDESKQQPAAVVTTENTQTEAEIAEAPINQRETEKVQAPETPVNETAQSVKEQDVVPETLFDQPEEKNATEEAILKARKAAESKKTAKAKPAEDKLMQDIEVLAQTPELKAVLEAPVAEGKKLSPEELKKQFHENLRQAAENAENSVNIEVRVIEN